MKANTYWKTRDTYGVVHVVVQAGDDIDHCTLHCCFELWGHADGHPRVSKETPISCVSCLAEVEPVLLRLLR